jgi:hypothetical protein
LKRPVLGNAANDSGWNLRCHGHDLRQGESHPEKFAHNPGQVGHT